MNTEPEMRILKVENCPSLSGKSTLTYQIGCTPEAEIQFRIITNTGTGFFSNEWVSLEAMLQSFAGKPSFTSAVLYPLFRGKSVNTHGFMLAVLRHEGLVKAQGRNETYVEPTGYMDALRALVDSPIADDKPKKVAKKTTKNTTE